MSVINFQPANSQQARVAKARAVEEERYLKVVMMAAAQESLHRSSPWFGRSPEYIRQHWEPRA